MALRVSKAPARRSNPERNERLATMSEATRAQVIITGKLERNRRCYRSTSGTAEPTMFVIVEDDRLRETCRPEPGRDLGGIRRETSLDGITCHDRVVTSKPNAMMSVAIETCCRSSPITSHRGSWPA
jgi:hypothetical protein